MECRWIKGQAGATDGLQPGDEVIVPVGRGFPRADHERIEIVVAVNDDGAAMTDRGTLIPCMYNPVFHKRRHFDTVEIPGAVRLRLQAGGWKAEI